jgi:hypothetical protein
MIALRPQSGHCDLALFLRRSPPVGRISDVYVDIVTILRGGDFKNAFTRNRVHLHYFTFAV